MSVPLPVCLQCVCVLVCMFMVDEIVYIRVLTPCIICEFHVNMPKCEMIL